SFGNNNCGLAYTREPYNLAYAPDPSKEGPVSNTTLLRLVRGLFDAAGKDGIYAYECANPAAGGVVAPKVSYAMIIPGGDWMIGAGVYVTDIERLLAAAEEDIDEAMTSAMGFILLVTIVVVIISLIVGLVIGRTVTAPLNKVSDMMQ